MDRTPALDLLAFLLTESLLIGDEDSWLHKPTLLDMPPPTERNLSDRRKGG